MIYQSRSQGSPMSATKQIISFEEYLTFADSTDNCYELQDGELLQMPQGRGKHGAIAELLNDQFRSEIQRLGLDWVSKKGDIGVRIPQVGRRDTSRVPDVAVVTREQWRSILNVSAVLTDSVPLLVVEVVSEGTVTVDHRRKRADYNALQIPEYWIVDFIEDNPNVKEDPKVTVLKLVEGLYEGKSYRGAERIESDIFPELTLTAEQILNVEG